MFHRNITEELFAAIQYQLLDQAAVKFNVKFS